MAMDGLRISASGMLASQKALEVISNNVANSGNDSYSRQKIQLGTLQGAAASPGGVQVLGIVRVRDVFADATWRTESANAAAANARADILGKAEAGLGDLDTGLASLYDGFFSSWNQLSMSPRDIAAREAVINSARNLASEYRRLDASISSQVTDAKSYATGLITEVNGLLTRIGSLNGAINEAAVIGAQHNELLDQRDVATDRLSELIGAQVRYGPDGNPEIIIGGFPAVVGEYAAQLEVVGDGSTANPLGVGIVGGARLSITGGKIGGAAQAVNVDLPDLRTRLDQAALALKNQVNGVHTAGYDLDGNPGTDLFVGTTAGDLYVAFDEDGDPSTTFDPNKIAAAATTAAGDGNQALVMAKLRQDGSVGSAVSEVRAYTVNLGAAVDGARRTADIAQNVLDGSSTVRRETSGVNADEEMIELIRFQRAFQASAKAVAVADEVLDTIVNRMIR